MSGRSVNDEEFEGCLGRLGGKLLGVVIGLVVTIVAFAATFGVRACRHAGEIVSSPARANFILNVETLIDEMAKEVDLPELASRVHKVTVVYEHGNSICRIQADAPQDDEQFIAMTGALFGVVGLVEEDEEVRIGVDQVEILYDEGRRSEMRLRASIEDIGALLVNEISVEAFFDRVDFQGPTLSPSPWPTPSLNLYLADFIELLGKMVEEGDAIKQWFDSEYEATNGFLDVSEEEWWNINDEFAKRYIVLSDEMLEHLSDLSVPLEARSFHDEFTTCIEQSRNLLVEARSAIAERSETKFGEAMANGGRLQEQCVTRAVEEWDKLSDLVAP